MSSLGDPSECKNCGHPGECHEAGECWWDRAADAESWDPEEQCDCGWYEPILAGLAS